MSSSQIPSQFPELGLPAHLMEAVTRLGFTVPTEIQAQAIPLALEGRDIVGIAQTGTGKTLAFALPVLANLVDGEIALILVPTRELAQQCEESFAKLNTTTAVLIGGADMNRQVAQLRRHPEVIVATPGRLLDHIQQGNLWLRNVGIVVLDEADRMLDLGFSEPIKRILQMTFSDRQTLLFSATMPKGTAEIADTYMRHPVRIDCAPSGRVAEKVEHELAVVAHVDKDDVLEELLEAHEGSVLVFTRTRHGARKLADRVRENGHTAAEIHSDRSQLQRNMALQGFKNGRYRVLVATDVASRGIDVQDIALVVNYDIPENPEDYVHRIGRTARAGASGRAVTLVLPEQHRDVRDIEQLIGMEIPTSNVSRLEMRRAAPKSFKGKTFKKGKNFKKPFVAKRHAS